MLLITRMIQICSFMIVSVCFDRHAARHKAVLVAHLRTAHVLHSKFSNPYASRRRRQAQRILELHRIGRIFIAAHTSDNTTSAMRGKLKDYRVRKAKAKKPCISALSNKTVCTFHKVGPLAAPPKQSPDAGAAFGYATQAQQLFCFEVAVCFLCLLLVRYGATAWHMWMCTG